MLLDCLSLIRVIDPDWMHHFTPGGNSKKIKMAASDGDGQMVRPVT